MPGSWSGLDLAMWARKHHPRLPVVIATGYTNREIPRDFEQLRKPYDIDTLLSALRRSIKPDR